MYHLNKVFVVTATISNNYCHIILTILCKAQRIFYTKFKSEYAEPLLVNLRLYEEDCINSLEICPFLANLKYTYSFNVLNY